MIEFRNIEIAYNDSVVVEDFNFSIKKGQIVCFFGPSGCGKSTLLKTALGIVKQAKGQILLDDIDSNDYVFPIGYAPQDNELFRWLNVYQNINLWNNESKDNSKIINSLTPNESMYLLELTGTEKKMPYELSGGMARRTVLARSISTNSEFIFLDEAFVSVERDLRRKIMRIIREHIKKNNITSIIVSHDYEEAVFMSDTIVFLSALPAKIAKVKQIDLPEKRKESLFDSDNFRTVTLDLI